MPWIEAVSWEVHRDDSNTAWVYIHDRKHNTARFCLVPLEGRNRPPVSVNHIHVESASDPTTTLPATDPITSKTKFAMHKLEQSEIQSPILSEPDRSDACEHTYQENTQKHHHQDMLPEDHSPINVHHIHVESTSNPTTTPPATDLSATKAMVAVHTPEPSETRLSDLPEHIHSDVHKPIDPSTQGNRNFEMDTSYNTHKHALHHQKEALNKRTQTDDKQENTSEKLDVHLEPNYVIRDVTTLHSLQQESITEHLDWTLHNIACSAQYTTRCTTHPNPEAAEATSYI
ncbi:hypothetical protein EV182_004785 [Spiromyces aspiralis]|uniref:Uncharacterized protein n=1 Tax=Spiromyces aspiralis TaxID=68401 RepID=A0ACC1HNG3_9FUNG|nr:hypothetical protein EV182_004785 [Spiromyces aspiralis]